MIPLENRTVVNDRHLYRQRHRILLSCTECHRRKQKCDRLQPCQHCMGRSKPDLCRYENNDSKSGRRTATSVSIGGSNQSRIQPSISRSLSLSETSPLSPQNQENLVTVFGYSTHSEYNTISLAKQMGAISPSTSSRLSVMKSKRSALDDKYRSLVRQLPSKEHIDILLHQYFSDINWHYDVIDEITFRQQLEDWRHTPYSAHTNPLSVLPADVLAFPSLLFQLMAHALIHQPVTDETFSSFESLKYVSDMTFLDLACDFSEAGFSILELIGKEQVTLVAVQSGILRASLLKNTGNVIEAWHVLGITIRDAQEIGLHAELALQDTSISVDAQWDKEMRRRIWFVLHNWDIHMAVVLGRPITTTIAPAIALCLPDDLAQRDMGTPPRQRTAHDPPTPFHVIRVGYDVAYQYFPRVRSLESCGARAEDYHIVRETHITIVENMNSLPLWCRHDDPDVHFDGLPGCQWLPAARQALTSGIYFVLLSLHRPYIFSAAESRTEVLKASLKILTVQKQLFHLSKPQQYISFNMVYPLFDAMVLSLATIMLFPKENLEILSELVQNVRWSIDILGKLGQHNGMAHLAHGVARKLFSRLEQSDGRALQHTTHNSEGEREDLDTGTADLDSDMTCLNGGLTIGNVEAAVLSPAYQQPRLSGAWNLPDFRFQTLLPPQPVHDLFYQNIHAPDMQNACQDIEFFMESPDFDGHYPDNSFWSFVNNCSQL